MANRTICTKTKSLCRRTISIETIIEAKRIGKISNKKKIASFKYRAYYIKKFKS